MERFFVSAALAATFLASTDGKRSWKAPWIVRLSLFFGLSWFSLGWTVSVPSFPDVFPLELPASRALALQLATVCLGAAAFAAARGRGGLAAGAAFGLVSSFTGWCASRWPHLARAVELCGGVFLSLLIRTFLTTALAASHAALAAALVREDWRPWARRVVLAVVGVWALATFAAEGALSLGWGFGPRSLPAAVGVPTNESSSVEAIAWLYPTEDAAYRVDAVRMSTETTDLSTYSLDRLEAFLARTKFRGVFAAEALAAVRLGRLQWWDEERALDALMITVPGRAHPDYLRALELLRAGPVTAERYGKLEQLSAATGKRVEGFEKAGDSQRIFEGFSAAYARFGDEAKAREWLMRLDGLWAVSEKRIEAGPLEDLREGRVEGSVFLGGEPATSLRAGLFFVWRSSATQSTHYWLSGSRVPDADGRFVFDGLGPGRYALALLGRPDDLRGAIAGSPGYFEVTYERPDVLLNPVRIARERAPADEPFGPGGLPERRIPPPAEHPHPLRMRR